MTTTHTTPHATAGANPGDCLVRGHSRDQHGTDNAVCIGTDGMCQCHGYNHDEHPA